MLKIKDGINGNSTSATTLQTARTLTIGSTGKAFNGSANVAWSLSEIGAAASSHTHSYLPLSGGTLTNKFSINYLPGYNTSQMTLYTDDGNTAGDGRTHLAYRDGDGKYCHHFRGKGRTYIDTWDGCSILTTLSVGSDLYIAGTSITEAKALVIGRLIDGDFVEAKYRPYHLYNVRDLSTSGVASIKRGACMISRQSSQQENVLFLSESAVSPGWDNGLYCGVSSHRFAAIHASTGTVYSSSKDEKNNIQSISVQPLNEESKSVKDVIKDGIKDTNIYSYSYNTLKNNDVFVGFLGQELEEQSPEFFRLIGNSYEKEDGVKQYDIREASVIGVLWSGLQDALNEIENLKTEIKTLKGLA